jgi:hypothetical protein
MAFGRSRALRTHAVSDTLRLIQNLVHQNEVRVSDHGYEELAADRIAVRDVVENLPDAVVVEDYPDFPKGPCVLVLVVDRDGNPVHAVWGIPKGATRPAVLVTAYRPDPNRWTSDFTRRKT